MPKRILIAGFKHETNTFSVLPTDLAAYEARGLHRGARIAEVFPGTNTEIAAFLDGCKQHGWEPVLSIVGDATPSGKLTRDCYETIAGEIVDAATRGGLVDAVLLNLHGAMVAEHTFDGEGTLLERLRGKLGPNVPIVGTLDLHANVTDAMAKYADVLVSYRTYPHIDMYEIAAEAVTILARTLAGEIKPRSYVARSRQIMGLDEGRTTQPGPMTEALAALADLKRRDANVLAASVNAGFYKADIPEVGPTCVIVGNADDVRFQRMADDMAAFIWETRHRKTVTQVSVAEAIARAKAAGRAGAPVVIADYADNPGGGGYCDSTGLLRGMIEAGLTNAAMAQIFDPETAQQALGAGVGATIDVRLGGKIEPRFGPPIEASATVTHASDGSFILTGPMLTGVRVDCGPTVGLRIGSVEVVVVSQRMQNYDLGFFRIGGIEPREKAVLAVKSMQHFRGAYAPIASEIVVVDEGGGITSHDIRRLPWRNVRQPVYPLHLD